MIRNSALGGLPLYFLLAFPGLAPADTNLVYRVSYDLAKPSLVHVAVDVTAAASAPLTLIIPRTVPGGYAQRPYDPFVKNVKGYSTAGTDLTVERDELGPRWRIGWSGDKVSRVEYDVDVAQMEREILSASDSSRIREGYASLLGYSIFGFFEGREHEPLRLEVAGPRDWPVFSTLTPHAPADLAAIKGEAADYYALADSQITMGPNMQLRKIDGKLPLYLSVYAECEEDLVQEGQIAREALDQVAAYFDKVPFAHYTVLLELLRPVSERHAYNFSMEHLDSGTFYLSTDRAITEQSSAKQREIQRFNYAHHTVHSWIPKRAYGTGYLPFQWEAAPVIDTIWFNEGFARYAAMEALGDGLPAEEARRYRERHLAALRGILQEAPQFIRRMALVELSREGSFLYSEDFRVGQNLFARGALMAAAMDDSMRLQTAGKKRLRDALRYLLDWSERNHRGFRIEELSGIFREATGVDTTKILERWMKPPMPESGEK
jgi:predicted metalloprotease with PDZ domain